MAYTVDLVKEHGYARLTFMDPLEGPIFEKALKETYAALVKNRWHKILLDVTPIEIKMPMTELYVFISMFRTRMMMDVYFAVLARVDQMQMIALIEHMARDSGMKFKVCSQRDAALQWLGVAQEDAMSP
jgi:hypothetical protein